MPESIGQRMSPSYLVGAYLAVNAIEDAALLVDGPSCVFEKARRIHGQHDLRSTLLRSDGMHRIHHTGVDPTEIATTYESKVGAAVEHLAAQPFGALLVSAMPMCTVAGTDYERLIGRCQSAADTPILLLPDRSLSDDWLGGYASVMEALAAGLPLTPSRQTPERVAIVGYCMDRNEGDHHGNLAELRRLLEALELEVVSIWLSGGSVESLRAAQHAGTIVALPHAGRAAEILARRVGAQLVSATTPHGFQATRRWLLEIAAATGKQEAAHALVQHELADVVPALEWAVPQLFVNRRFVFVGDPHYALPVVEQLQELGGETVGLFLTSTPQRENAELLDRLTGGALLRTDPTTDELLDDWRSLVSGRVDLLVSNSLGLEILRPRVPWVEWGYPSHYTHAYRDEPFLGFQGTLAFLGRIANAMSGASVSTP